MISNMKKQKWLMVACISDVFGCECEKAKILVTREPWMMHFRPSLRRVYEDLYFNFKKY